MKHLLLFIVLGFASVSSAQTRYVERSLEPYASRTHWLSPAEGIVFGVFLNVQYTNDSGKTWRKRSVPDDQLHSRQLSNGILTDSLNWKIYGGSHDCGGSFHFITTDGGVNWAQFDTACKDFWSNPFTNVYHTRAGKSVELREDFYRSSIDLDMYDTSMMIAVWNEKPYITYRSFNEYPWKTLIRPDSSRARSIRSVDLNVWRLETDSGSYLSTDNALSWKRLRDQPHMRDVRFTDRGVGFGTGTKGYFYSKDSGQSWRAITNMDFSGEERVWAFDKETAYFWDDYHLIEVFGIDANSMPYLKHQPDGLAILLGARDTTGSVTLHLQNQNHVGVRIDSIHFGGEGFSIRRMIDSLAPWSTDSVIIEWKPGTAQTSSGWVKIFSQAWMKNDTIWIDARIQPLQLTASRSSVRFGSQFIGDTASVSILIESAFGQPFHFKSGSSSSGEFMAILDSAKSPTQTYMKIVYQPKTIGIVMDTVTLSFEGDTRVLLPVTGSGKQPLPITYKSYIGEKDKTNSQYFGKLHSTAYATYVVGFRNLQSSELFRVLDIDDIRPLNLTLAPIPEHISMTNSQDGALLIGSSGATYSLFQLQRDGKYTLLHSDSLIPQTNQPFAGLPTPIAETNEGIIWYGVNLITGYRTEYQDNGKNYMIGLLPDRVSMLGKGFNVDCSYPNSRMQRKDWIYDVARSNSNMLLWSVVNCDTTWKLIQTTPDGDNEEILASTNVSSGQSLAPISSDTLGNTFILLSSVVRVAADGSIRKIESLNPYAFDFIEPDNGGGFFSLGRTYENTSPDVVVSHLDSVGNLIWKYIHSDPYMSGNAPLALHVRDSLVYIVSQSTSVTVFALRSTGELAWSRRYDPGKGARVDYKSSTVDSAGNLWVAGGYRTDYYARDWLVKFGDFQPNLSLKPSLNQPVLRLFPNPATHLINVDRILSGHRFSIRDMLGRASLSGIICESGKIEIDLQPGMYFLDVSGDSGSRLSGFVVER